MAANKCFVARAGSNAPAVAVCWAARYPLRLPRLTDFVWHRLERVPAGRESLRGVRVLRLDCMGGAAPGNKWFKLGPCITEARSLGFQRLLSFGGAWSNHLHALARIGQQEGFTTIGVVRGEPGAPLTAALADAVAAGMTLVHLSRSDYRRRHQAAFQRQLLATHGPAYLIPEGGDCLEGVSGCLAIGRELARAMPAGGTIILPVGTGTTLAGITAALGQTHRVVGVSALKGALDTEQRVQRHLDELAANDGAQWEIRHDFHCGGFARTSAGLRDFTLAMEHFGLPLEPVYTAKALYALHRMLDQKEIDAAAAVVFVHTGGLQGRRGFSWLSNQPAQ